MRLEGVRKDIFHIRGCDCVQKRMRRVSQSTQVVATSFVWERQDRLKFDGTVPREKIWLDKWRSYLGETRGRGRMDQHHEAHERSVKRIYIYPLCRNVRNRLAQRLRAALDPV